MKIAVITCFPNHYYNLCAKDMLESFDKFWPKNVDLYIHLDDGALAGELMKMAPDRENIFISCEKAQDHADFLERNKDRDSAEDYRKQALRFSHKPSSILDTLQYMKDNPDKKTDYIIWLDADVITKETITEEWLSGIVSRGCSYLGRKDWPHSECGFMAFNTDFAYEFMEKMWLSYQTDSIFEQEQWDDSWIFDLVRKSYNPILFDNLSPNVPGNNVWPQSLLGEKMEHLKGPVAKNLNGAPQQKKAPLSITTLNAVPDKEILDNIEMNRALIHKWVEICENNRETVVMVSAGESLDVEHVRGLYRRGHKVVAVKHALKRLTDAGIIPWATILLDPRDHVKGFIEQIPKQTIVFVASQCNPDVTYELLARGLRVIGYHASVNVKHVWREGDTIVGNGSATATRGLFVLQALGFYSFELFGYDLCYFTKPDLEEMNDQGSHRFLEIEISTGFPHDSKTRQWYTEGQFAAQVNEMRQILVTKGMKFRAHGDGIIGWMDRSRHASDLKAKEIQSKLSIKKMNLYKLLDESPWNQLKYKIRRMIAKR